MQLSYRFSRNTAIALIIIASCIAYFSAWNDSIIIDEDPHIGAGYSYIVKQDMRLNPEHPPLAKDLAGLALLPLGLNNNAFSSDFWNKDINGQWEFGRKLIFNTGNNANLITHAAKIPPILIFALAGWIIFYWTSKRYGNLAGLLALTLFSFSPTVMAHARFVTTDVPAALGVLLSTYLFIRYLKNQTKKNFILAAIGFGLALVMKFSTVLLGPYFIVLTCIWNWRNIWKTLCVMAVGFAVIVWPLYAFHTWNYPIERQHRDTEDILRSFGNRMLADPVVWASGTRVLRAPAQYAFGLLMVTQRSAGGNTVYFRGTTTNTAGPIYFPYVYLIKEPLPWLILLLFAVIFAIFNFKRSFKIENLKLKIDEIAMLLWIIIYWVVSIRSTLNIGVRHLLPVYPFMIILVSGIIANLFKNAKIKFVFCILVGWYMFENLSVFPYYLTYFNEFAGGPSGGYRYVVDSNLDWGQDLKRFSYWVKDNNINKIELNYFGWADQKYYLGDRFIWLSEDKYLDEKDFMARNESNGWLAVSATYLQNERNAKYKWLADRTPIAVIGNSIFIYRITP